MVDATASMEGNSPTAAMLAKRASAGRAVTEIVVSEATADALARYAAFCEKALHAPAQGVPWARMSICNNNV